MGIVLVRVDSRLIHGQILEAWIPYTKANAIVVVDDEVSRNVLRRSVMEMAVPSSVEVTFDTVDEVVDEFKNGVFSQKSTIVLFSNIIDLKTAYDRGFTIKNLNLGNMHYCEGKVQISKNICVGLGDSLCIRELSEKGVVIDSRSVPVEKNVELIELIEKVKTKK